MLKLISTETDGSTMQLTYTDGDQEPTAAEMMVVRMPLEGNMKRSLLWHQMNIMFRVAELAAEEARRLRAELEKND